LSENHHRVRIAAELGDIRADPFQRVHDVEHANIARLGKLSAAEFLEVGEPEHVQPMVDADHHHVTAPRQVRSVGDR